jgi:hypothetical protein
MGALDGVSGIVGLLVMSHILWKSYLFATLFIRQILRHFEAKKAHFSGGLAGVSKTVVFETLLCGVMASPCL